jgi:hypothetical protein
VGTFNLYIDRHGCCLDQLEIIKKLASDCEELMGHVFVVSDQIGPRTVHRMVVWTYI